MDLSSLDFQQARIKQVLFKSQLRSVVYGVRAADEALWQIDHNPLMQWILTVIQPKYGDDPTYATLETELHRMLRLCRELVTQYQNGALFEARAGLGRLDASSDRITELLRQLEERATDAPVVE